MTDGKFFSGKEAILDFVWSKKVQDTFVFSNFSCRSIDYLSRSNWPTCARQYTMHYQLIAFFRSRGMDSTIVTALTSKRLATNYLGVRSATHVYLVLIRGTYIIGNNSVNT